MGNLVKKLVLGLVIAGLMSSSVAMHPAEARSRHGRGVVIAVGVVGLIALLGHHHKHKGGGITLTTAAPSTAPTGTAPAATAPATR